MWSAGRLKVGRPGCFAQLGPFGAVLQTFVAYVAFNADSKCYNMSHNHQRGHLGAFPDCHDVIRGERSSKTGRAYA